MQLNLNDYQHIEPSVWNWVIELISLNWIKLLLKFNTKVENTDKVNEWKTLYLLISPDYVNLLWSFWFLMFFLSTTKIKKVKIICSITKINFHIKIAWCFNEMKFNYKLLDANSMNESETCIIAIEIFQLNLLLMLNSIYCLFATTFQTDR